MSTDSGDSDQERLQVQESTYLLAGLGEAIRSEENYTPAVEELALWIEQHYPALTKGAQALAVADAHAAVASYDGRARSKLALAKLARAVEKRLPSARRAAFSREYRQRSVQVHRQGRRGAGEGGGSDTEAEEAVGVGHLPEEVLAVVFRYLDPVSLGSAACVDSTWQRAAAEEALWEALLESTFQLPETSSRLQPGSARKSFARLAARHPRELLRWRTNRAFLRGRLMWEPPLRLPGTRPAHGYLKPTDAVDMLWLKSQVPQRVRADAGGRESSDSDSDPSAAFNAALRFLTIR